ncbi:MAG: YIP1 family protein [Candidatus Hydrogenedentota bacterium]
MDDRDDRGSWQGGGEHRDDAPESSPYEGESDIDPSRPFGHVNPSAPLSYEPSPHEPYGGGPQGPDEPLAPLEPLNPWISILLRPRDTIRYVLETGVWNNWILVYTIIYVSAIPPGIVSMFAQPESSGPSPLEELPFTVTFGVVAIAAFLFFIVIAYPIALLFVMFNAWLYRVVGGWLGGVGTTAEVRTAAVWASVVFAYMQYIAIVPNTFAAIYYHTAVEVLPIVPVILMGIMFLIMFPLYVYGMVVNCKALGEAHRFSAWRGLGTILISSVMVGTVVLFFVVTIVIAIIGLVAAAG